MGKGTLVSTKILTLPGLVSCPNAGWLELHSVKHTTCVLTLQYRIRIQSNGCTVIRIRCRVVTETLTYPRFVSRPLFGRSQASQSIPGKSLALENQNTPLNHRVTCVVLRVDRVQNAYIPSVICPHEYRDFKPLCFTTKHVSY
jgi:hypothetical protein